MHLHTHTLTLTHAHKQVSLHVGIPRSSHVKLTRVYARWPALELGIQVESNFLLLVPVRKVTTIVLRSTRRSIAWEKARMQVMPPLISILLQSRLTQWCERMIMIAVLSTVVVFILVAMFTFCRVPSPTMVW